MNRLHDRKRTDERDAERTMAPVLAAIEQRWLERAATAGADDDSFSGGIDPDLELVALTNPNVRVLLFRREDF